MADDYVEVDMDKFLHRNKELLRKVDDYVLSAESKGDKNRLLLCMSQIQKILKLLIGATHSKGKNVFGLKEIIKYLGKRLEWCIEQSENVLSKQNVKSSGDNENYFGQFVQRVDQALHIMTEGINCDEPNTRNWKQIVEDILCQALTIAGMAGGIDYEEITASCHKVLAECNRLEEDCPDGFNTSLQREFLADWLLQLERRVSTALLRLVLKTYSDFLEPLKKLILAIDEDKDIKSPTDLDSIVDSFDLHSDCIQHIALCALACSEYSKNVLKIRCCLASLESLDDSLVPAAVALYLDPYHAGKRQLLKFLASVWVEEVKSLEEHLDCIIDPIAFSAVTLESIEMLMDEVETTTIVDSTNVQPLISIVLQAGRLDRHLNISLPDFESNLTAIITECRSALHAWLKNEEDHHNQPVTLKRVLKRFNILLHTIRKISTSLSSDLAMKNSSYQNTSALLKDMSLPESIKDLPIDISSTTSFGSRKIGNADLLQKLCYANFNKKRNGEKFEKDDQDESLLKPYKLKAIEKSFFINTLYAPSPRRVMKATPSTVVHKSCDTQFEQTLGLDLTDILERFADISHATLSTIDYSSDSGKFEKPCVIRLGRGEDKMFIPDLSGICLLEDSLSRTTTTVSRTFNERTDVSSVITIDRLNDLKKVEDRIEYLRGMVNT